MNTATIHHNHNYNSINLNFDAKPLLDAIRSIRNGAATLKMLWRFYRFLDKIEAYIQYAVVDEDDIKSVEEMVSAIDDTLDDLDEILPKTNIFKRILLNKIYTKLVNIEFILSNKVADYISENNQDQPL